MNALRGFELLRDETIQDHRTGARLLRHLKTGAQVLSLENEDENKVFGVTFRTPTTNSTGVAHILEHSVLCGSRKYPLKDPFVEMSRSSLKTFLNAFTYPDRTCYPVASQNVQDFYNLVDVYLDTVFHPRLSEHTFQEQGWHYELDNSDAPLAYKGVVFNEMKGAYSSPDGMLHKYVQQSLFPDNAYGVDSGGDPREIPNLTYEQFKAFHESYYHPANARIFFYGDDDPEKRLEILDGYLDAFEPRHVESSVRLQPLFSDSRRFSHSYPAGEGNGASKRAMFTVNWMLDEVSDAESSLSLGLLSSILVGTAAAPLRKALLDSGLGEDVIGGMPTHLRQVYFYAGLKGIEARDAEGVEELIDRTLRGLVRDGIDPQTVEAALNSTEFSLRENNTGSTPRGLSLMLRALTAWLYDRDPFTRLAFEAPLASIRTHVERGSFFEDLIDRRLLKNSHRTTVLLQPDPEMGRRLADEERARLEAVRAGMSTEELQSVLENTQSIKQIQETPDPPEALASLPALELEDLDPRNRTIPLEERVLEGTRTLYHDLFTNGIIYLDLGMDLHNLPQSLMPYLPLFGRALLQIGTESEDYVRLTQRIGQKTGGVWRSSLVSSVRDTSAAAAWMFLSGKATLSQATDLLAILRDVLLTVRLDNQERFRQLALEEKARLEASLAPGGSGYVAARMRSRFNEASWIGEQMGGVSYVFFLRELVQAIDEVWPGVLAALNQIRQTLVNRAGMLCNVTVDAENWSRFAPQLEELLADFPEEPVSTQKWSPGDDPGAEGLVIPSQVNYVGKAANVFDLGYRPDGSASVILNHLRSGWLWDRVRKEGGAYGVSASLDRLSGVLSFTSYRDPNLLKTLEVYDGTSRFLRECAPTGRDLTRNIIGAIGGMDQYQLPDAKGYSSMARVLIGETEEDRQQWRDQILSTTAADFKEFAGVLEGMKDQSVVTVMGSRAAIDGANAARPGWLKVVNVL